MGKSKRVVPIFPVRDLAVSLEHYRSLGFRIRVYKGGGYAYAVLDDAEIHLGIVAEGHHSGTASAYLFVDDAGELARAWAAAGATVRLPEDTAWGQYEGVMTDPDGNIIRFGSPGRSGTT